MLDNALIKEILVVINAGLALWTEAAGLGITVKQSFQPTQQGANTLPTVYLFKMPDHRYGFKRSDDRWDEDNEVMVHTETQWMETAFQITTTATQNPADVNGITASDIANRVAAILQSDATLEYFKSKAIGILRITDIRNPTFTDDRDRFEYAPNFDFTLEHEQVIISSSPSITTYEANFKRV